MRLDCIFSSLLIPLLVRAAAIGTSFTDDRVLDNKHDPSTQSLVCGSGTCSSDSCTSAIRPRTLLNSSYTLSRRNLRQEVEGKTQAQLAKWITDRVAEPDVQKIFDESDAGTRLKMERTDFLIQDVNIPTAKFKTPGDVPFAWAVTGMGGCTSLLVIREPDAITAGGVYFAHYWEAPGFVGVHDRPRHREPPFNHIVDANGNLSPMQRVIPSLFEAYVPQFLMFGFPHHYIPFLPPPEVNNIYSVTMQPSLATHRNALSGGIALIITPQNMSIDDRDLSWHEPDSDAPEHPKEVAALREAIEDVFWREDGEVDIKFLPDFLYLPNRVSTPYESEEVGRIGKIFFGYDPESRQGMLLVQDGGRQTEQEDGTMRGAGGPYFFNFTRPTS